MNDLELYQAGKLDSKKRFAVENHLADCEACRDYVDGLALLTGKNDLDVIDEKLKEKLRQMIYPKKKNRFFIKRFQYIMVAASILLVLGISTFLMQRLEKHSEQIAEQLIPKQVLPVDDTILTYEPKGEEIENEIISRAEAITAQNIDKKEVRAKQTQLNNILVSTNDLPNEKVVEAPTKKTDVQSITNDIVDNDKTIRIRGVSSINKNNYAYGKIVDEKGEAVPGVKVYNLNQKNGVVSNADGSFIIAAQPGDSLQIAFIGFEQMEITVDAQQELNIKMKPSVLALEEVTVVGYGTMQKKELTGSVASSKVKVNAIQRLIHPNWKKAQKMDMRYSAQPDSIKNEWTTTQNEALKNLLFKNEYAAIYQLEKLLSLSCDDYNIEEVKSAIGAVKQQKYSKARRIVQKLNREDRITNTP